eukprot:m.363496 g.363496  ORF g.363496 m.363496 type:complete len:533 (-) comp22803_c0_seq1:28-1626(-)
MIGIGCGQGTVAHAARAAVVVALGTLLCSVGVVSAQSVDVPQQTKVQEEVYNQWVPQAQAASSAATPTLEQMFASPTLTKMLKLCDDGTGLYRLDSTALIAKFWDAIAIAELTHNFGEGAFKGANCGFDLTIDSAKRAKSFANQWVLQVDGEVPIDVSNNAFTEWAEVNLFKFPPFANVSQPDLKTALDRPLYAAVNMYKGSGGNPQCGPIAAVFSRQYLQQRILAAPVDTGFFNGCCRRGNPNTTCTLGSHIIAKCSAWVPGTRTLGVPPHMNHLVAPYLNFYNETEALVGKDYPYYKLARLLVRLLSPNMYTAIAPQYDSVPHRLNFLENTLGYFELNPVAIVPWKGGIKMLVGLFELLWGTDQGNALVEWCIEMDWVLAWAFNPTMSYWRCGPDGNYPECNYPSSLGRGIDPANVRMVDPRVLSRVSAGHNATAAIVSNSTVNAVTELWTSLNVTSASRQDVASVWTTFTGQPTHQTTSQQLSSSVPSHLWRTLAMEPLSPNSCANLDCVGVMVNSRNCLCPTPSNHHF